MAEGLFERFIAFDNFKLALDRVAGKKSSGGVDGMRVEDFQKRATQHVQSLIQQIKDGTYLPKPVQAFSVPKFNDKSEWRELGLPAVSDKIVQAAMLQVLQPVTERLFKDTSYGYRPGKGPYKALRRVEHNIKNGKCIWVANRDIDNFFDSLNHDRLVKKVSDLVNQDERFMRLVALWVRMGIVDRKGRWRNVEAGVRQGQILSPLLANLYLHDLDELAHSLGLYWVRYADNYIIMTGSMTEAESTDRAVIEFLDRELSLKVNVDDQAIRSLEMGFDFLGVRFQGDTRSISPDKLNKIGKKIEWSLSAKNRAPLALVLRRLEEKVQGWTNYYGFLNPKEHFEQFDHAIEENLLKLAKTRIAANGWPKILPEGLLLPRLSGNNDADSGRKALELLWRRAVELASPVDTGRVFLQKVDKKVSCQRRRYRRQATLSGELFVLGNGSFVGKRGGRIFVRQERRVVGEALIEGMKWLTVGVHGTAISSDVIQTCLEKGIPLCFVDRFGVVRGVITGPNGLCSEMALLQVQKRDLPSGLNLGRAFVYGKLKNQFSLLKYYGKYRRNSGNPYGEQLTERRGNLEALMNKVRNHPIGDDPGIFRQQLMGFEGSFGAEYWGLLKHLLRNGIDFPGRDRRGAKDLVNNLLNYGYAVLGGRILNAISKTGLNPTGSFLHAYQSGKPTLVYDLVEEFRADVVDRAVFSLLNRGAAMSLGSDGLLDKPTKERLIRGVLARLGTEVFFLGKRQTIEEVIQLQAENVRYHLMGKRRYRPYLSRW